MNIESLVPPLDLCKQIPKGAFADSALVYGLLGHQNGEEVYAVWLRLSTDKGDKIIPAPTLQEIMEALRKNGNAFVRGDKTGWMVICEFFDDHTYDIKSRYDNDCPVNAALKLLLENGGE